jgi:hypothetical protein
VKNRLRRLTIVGGLLCVAAAVPALGGGVERVEAQCTAVFGSLNDGVCLDQPSNPGSPSVAIGPTDNGAPGISTGPLLPGQTINIPLAP